MPRLLVVILWLLLAGCSEPLLTGLAEREANESLAALLGAGIDADKSTPDAGKSWTVQVPAREIVRSLEVLKMQGLPRPRHATLGEIFKKDGLVSTPVEERVRFVHGVAQELSETLMRIDGVMAARVHIVLPQSDPMAPAPKPSSAAVFIKHKTGFSAGQLTAPVKNLVAHSVEGLGYDAVTVVFIESQPATTTAAKTPRAAIVWAGVLAATLAAVGAAAMAWKHRHRLRGVVGASATLQDGQ